MARSSIARAALLAVAIALLSIGTRASAETPASELYLRHPESVEQAASAIINWARAREATTLVVAFDVISFAPPPGDSEFTTARYSRDLDSWVKEFAREAPAGPTGTAISFATTGRTELVSAADSKAVAKFVKDLRATDWEATKSPVAETFASWASGALSKCAAGKRAVVLLGGVLPPEGREDGHLMPGDATRWRRNLQRAGEYWDEEKIISTFARLDASFAVVAPEARFCDYLPVSDLPQAPWASRPVQRPGFSSLPDDTSEKASPEPDFAFLRRELKARGLTDEEIEQAIAEIRRHEESSPAPVVAGGGPDSRFDSETPRFYRSVGTRTPFNTDCPSGFGYWPFARVAVARDGTYVFYPTRGGVWLDKCPRDAALLDSLAPSLGPRREWSTARAADSVMAAMLMAIAKAKAATPWRRTSGIESDGVWCGFTARSAGSSGIDDRWLARDLPIDETPFEVRPDQNMASDVKRLREAAKVYDSCCETLAGLIDQLGSKPDAQTSRRNDANLRLERFWLEVSACHLEAFAILLEGLSTPPRPVLEDGARLTIAYIPAFRLSDCLEGYDKLTISAADEVALAEIPHGHGHAGAQSNFLDVMIQDPRYRARRSLDAVFKNLDPRLLGRAKRIVAAAEALMKTYARTPWGWIVYYSDVETFVPWIVPPPKKSEFPDFGPSNPDTPSTPGSDPDGPKTPR